MIGYLLAVCVFRFMALLTRSPAPQSQNTEFFDIRDGARLVRVRFHDILTVASAGNYAEFFLRDGRTVLMRTSLSALNSALASHGFVRTHRSWIVNTHAVTGLRPAGSGDYAIDLGVKSVPLSRRYAHVLKHLRRT